MRLLEFMQPHPEDGAEATPDRQSDAAVYFGTAVGTLLLAHKVFIAPSTYTPDKPYGIFMVPDSDEATVVGARIIRQQFPEYDRPHDRLILDYNQEGVVATRSTYTLAPHGIVLRRDTEVEVTADTVLGNESEPMGVGWQEVKDLNGFVAPMRPI